jgi:hypothetical protein
MIFILGECILLRSNKEGLLYLFIVTCYEQRIVVLIHHNLMNLIIGFCILLRKILTVNNNTFSFATISRRLYRQISAIQKESI